MPSMDWVDKQEEKNTEERKKGYFNIVEGKQNFVLLTHLSPFPQVFDPATRKYRAAVEGDTPNSVQIKGVGWVLQDGFIKEAKIPYVVVKEIRALQDNPDWEFAFPFPHEFTLSAKGAGKKDVIYSINPSPKKINIPVEILAELKKKPTPEEIVERLKEGKKVSPRNSPDVPVDDYPNEDDEDIDTSNVPF